MSEDQTTKERILEKENGAQDQEARHFAKTESIIVIKQKGGMIEVNSSISLGSWVTRAILREALKLAEARGIEIAKIQQQAEKPEGEKAEE